MGDDGVVLDDAFHGACVVEAMVVVEASGGGAVWDFGAYWGCFFTAFFGYDFAGFWILVVEVEVPFSDDGCVVAFGLEDGGDGGAVSCDEVWFVA